ncbi:ORFL274W [Human betaherpesvirus 5]|nr:ORFL274W [Human betaherpesvirus 5]QHX40656.1 ORFL274W [Human betaherpesvirus 5]
MATFISLGICQLVLFEGSSISEAVSSSYTET